MNKKQPLVMCLTNTVAQDITANALLAIGAKPAMVEGKSEAAELSAIADAMLINLGTVHPRQADAMLAAVSRGQTPWVLDPVAAHLLTYRRELVQELLKYKPAIIRGNHAEIESLMGTVPSLAGSVPFESAVLSTGEIDRVFCKVGTDPQKVGTDPIEVRGGVEMLQKVTATGCAQGAICAAFLGWGQSPVEAALSASKLMKQAGEIAWGRAKAPGSFRVALLDALYELTHGGAGAELVHGGAGAEGV